MVFAACEASGRHGAHESPSRNLLLITCDTLRVDRLGAYGSKTARTPRLDALAARGVRFDRAHTPFPKTNPAIASLMTGRYPWTHGVRGNAGVLAAAETTLAERLREHGYTTAAFVGNQVLVRARGPDEGFDRYDDALPDRLADGKARERTAPKLVDAVLGWAGDGLREPFFLWVHFVDPHGPYLARPLRAGPNAGRDTTRELPVSRDNYGAGMIPKYQALPGVTRVGDYIARYDAEVELTDRQVGRLLDGLDARGLLDATLIVFTADHGESLGEHDLFFQHGSDLHQPQLHIPLIIVGPGVTAAVSDRTVSLVDVAPTLLEWLGLPPLVGAAGGSVAEELRGETGAAASAARPVFAELGDARAAIDASVKLVLEGESGQRELFDLAADPGETVNLHADGAPDARGRTLAAAIHRQFAGLQRAAATPDPGLRETLRALGYVE